MNGTKNKTIAELLFEIEILKEKAIKSEKLNKSIVKTSTDAIITIDRGGCVLSWNRAAKRIFGYNSNEILGKSISEFLVSINQLKKEDLDRFLSTVLKRKVEQTFEFLVQRKGGEEFTTELSISKWKSGKSIYFTGVFRDLTERKKKDFLLKKLDLALKNSKDIILMTDPEGVITYVNPQFTKTYGYESCEVVGKHTPRVIKGTNDNKRFELLWETLLNKKSFRMSHYQNKKRDGGLIDLESTIDPILNDERDIVGFLGIQHDITKRIKYITELEEAIDKAKESDRLKSQFLSTMSHELRTPLNSIIGLSNLIDRDTPLDDIIEYTQLINNSGEHLLKLIENLFDISLIESGKAKVFEKTIDLPIFLNEVHELMKIYQEKTGKSHVAFNLIIPLNCKKIAISTDALKLKHILVNLLKNAFKFTEKGEVNYGFEVCNKQAVTNIKFFVSDTGIGIDKVHQDFIFNGFAQVDGSYNRHFEGIGVGLTLAKKLVHLFDGHIWIDSELGNGSTFFFSFPISNIGSDIVIDNCDIRDSINN